MPYDKFEQAAPIEVLPNIQPQVDESMIRAVQTASQAFEARAKRKQEEEQAASAAKAAERKRLLEIKVPTGTSPIAAIQNGITKNSNEAFINEYEGKSSEPQRIEIEKLKGYGDSLIQFTTNIGGVMTKAKEKYGAAFETPKEYAEWTSVISNPNASIDEVFQVKNKLESTLATPYKTLNFGKLGDIWLDKNKNAGYATNIQRGLTTTGQTIQSRIWFTDKTKPLVINGVTQKDANGDVIYEQRPPANREETNEAALKFLQSEDGAVGTMLSQKIQEEDAPSINQQLNNAIEEYKKANWNAPMAKPSEPSESWKEAYKKGILDKMVVEAAKDIMWDNQQAYVSAYNVTKKEPSKAAGAGAKEKIDIRPSANNIYNLQIATPQGGTKQELTKAAGTVEIIDDGKPLKFQVPPVRVISSRDNVSRDFNQSTKAENPVTRYGFYTLGKRGDKLLYAMTLPEKATKEQKQNFRKKTYTDFANGLSDEQVKQIDGITPFVYFNTDVSGEQNIQIPEKQRERLFELDAKFKNKPVNRPIRPKTDDKNYENKLNSYNNALAKYKEYQEYLDLKEKMPRQKEEFYTDFNNVSENISNAAGLNYDENTVFGKLSLKEQNDITNAQKILERRKRELSSAPTPAKSGGTKGGGTKGRKTEAEEFQLK